MHNSKMSDHGKRIRLHKHMADCGLASRRDAEKIIAEGRVHVNGHVVTAPGTTVDPDTDLVEVDGRRLVRESHDFSYYAFHKPPGYLTAARDPYGRKTIYEFLQKLPVRVVPVGRLDRDSEGLLLLTNDGQWAHRLMHPRFHVEKEYHVQVEGHPSAGALTRMRSPVQIEGRMTQPAKVRLIRSEMESTWLSFTIREGRKRQVRVICTAAGHRVLRLVRIREGRIALGDLQMGQCRNLTRCELESLAKEQ